MKLYQHNPRARFYSWKFNSYTCVCNRCPPFATILCALLHHYSHPFIHVERNIRGKIQYSLNFIPSIPVLLNPLVCTNVLNTGLWQSSVEYDLETSWMTTLFILRCLADLGYQWFQMKNKH